MRTNRFIFLSLISSVALFSCGPKAAVTSEDENKGTVTFITGNNKLAMQAYPKDGYQFDGWFLKDNDDGVYRFESASNPYMVEFTKNVTYQAKFEPESTNKFDFTLEKDSSQIPTHYSISNFYGVGDQFKNVIIPNVHFGYPVKEIKKNTFSAKTNVETIYIPQNISIVASDVFNGCSALKEVTIDSKYVACLEDNASKLYEDGISVSVLNTIISATEFAESYIGKNHSAVVPGDTYTTYTIEKQS